MKTPSTRSVTQAVAAAVCLAAVTSNAIGGSFTRGCAARDLQILMLIEERESTRAIPTERLNDAMLTMLDARLVCHAGRVIDALSMYDSVARALVPDLTGSLGRGR